MVTHETQALSAGTPTASARGALILLHGRGSTAHDMLSMAAEFEVDGLALFAPQAAHRSWYPYSFMAPDVQNQTALDAALAQVGNVVAQIERAGIPAGKIFFMGFSQGACLTLEYLARNAKAYGGAVAFTGGLIGDTLDPSRYSGDFQGTSILVTTGDPDPHVPVSRVEASVSELERLGAEVTFQVYPGRAHTISRPEINRANELFQGKPFRS